MAQLRRREGSIVGRADDVRSIRAAVETGRLVTLLGPGGIGKTALAAEVLNELEPDFDQVVTVELAEARDESDVVRLLAAATASDRSAGLDRVIAALAANAPTLLVVDNCEHLIDQVAQVLSAVLDAVDDIAVMTTSRRPLELTDETTWTVRALSTPAGGSEQGPAFARKPTRPGAGSGLGSSGDGNTAGSGRDADADGEADRALTTTESVQLFLERVRQAVPTFELTAANRSQVASICDAAEGVPLALELAAALVRSQPLDEILRAMTADPARLTTGRRDRPEHQRSISASVDWSRQFLEPADAGLLDRLSIFVGGFTAEAARLVDPDGTGDGLARLVDHSLIDFDRSSGRYRILEVVRLDAEARLDAAERETLRRRHLDFCLVVVDRIEAAKTEADPDNRFRRFEYELGNLGAAARWALERQDLVGFRSLLGPIAVWWVHYMAPDDPATWETAFDDDQVPLLWRGNILSALAFHVSHRGQYQRSIDYGEAAAALHRAAGDLNGYALDEVSVGNAHLALDQPDRARDAYLRGLAAAEESGHPYPRMVTLVVLTRLDPDDPETPNRLMTARELAAVGFGVIEAAVTVELARHRLRTGDVDAARRLCDEALRSAEGNGYAEIVATALSARAEVAVADGDPGAAAELYARALDLGRRHLHQGVIEQAEKGLASLDRPAGDQPQAAGPATADHAAVLSDRELSVARLLRGDLTQREIAGELYIAPSTVKTHIKSIYRKLGVTKRSHAVTRAAELGLFD